MHGAPGCGSDSVAVTQARHHWLSRGRTRHRKGVCPDARPQRPSLPPHLQDGRVRAEATPRAGPAVVTTNDEHILGTQT